MIDGYTNSSERLNQQELNILQIQTPLRGENNLFWPKRRPNTGQTRSQWITFLPNLTKETRPLLSDPAFDVGPKIVEKYDFKLPKLTQALDETALAKYIQLLVSENPSFAEMFEVLASWLNSVPKLSEKKNA